jgi:putative oxidoreductase
VNRTLPGPAGDAALLLARLILGTIMFAHGYQKLFINGLGRTAQGFENMSITVAIVSASYVTVVELVGSVLVLPEP